MYRNRMSPMGLQLAILWFSIPLLLFSHCGTMIVHREVNLSLSKRYYEVIDLMDYIEIHEDLLY